MILFLTLILACGQSLEQMAEEDPEQAAAIDQAGLGPVTAKITPDELGVVLAVAMNDYGPQGHPAMVSAGSDGDVIVMHTTSQTYTETSSSMTLIQRTTPLVGRMETALHDLSCTPDALCTLSVREDWPVFLISLSAAEGPGQICWELRRNLLTTTRCDN